MALEFVLLVDQERLDKVDFDHLTGVQKLTKKGLEELGGNVLGAPGGLLSPTLRTINASTEVELTSFVMVSHVPDDLASLSGIQRNLSWDGPVTRFDPADGNHVNYPVPVSGLSTGTAYTNYIWAAPTKNDEDNDTRRVWDVVTGDEVAQNINTRGRSRIQFGVGETNPWASSVGGVRIVRLDVDAAGNITDTGCISAWDNEELHAYLFANEADSGGEWDEEFHSTQTGWLLETLLNAGPTNNFDLLTNLSLTSSQQDRQAGVVAMLQIIRFQLHRILGRGTNDGAGTLANAAAGYYPWVAKPVRSIASLYGNQELQETDIADLQATQAAQSQRLDAREDRVLLATGLLHLSVSGGGISTWSLRHSSGIASVSGVAGDPTVILDSTHFGTGNAWDYSGYRPCGFSSQLAIIDGGSSDSAAVIRGLRLLPQFVDDPLSPGSAQTLVSGYESGGVYSFPMLLGSTDPNIAADGLTGSVWASDISGALSIDCVFTFNLFGYR